MAEFETDQGMFYYEPFDSLLKDAARLVPKERWQTCPKCGNTCPLFYGDPDGEHWCAICELDRRMSSTT